MAALPLLCPKDMPAPGVPTVPRSVAAKATLSAAAIALVPAAALAAGPTPAAMEPQVTQATTAPAAAEPDLIFTLRGGISAVPEYFGSNDYQIGPDAAVSLNFLSLGGRSFGSSDPGDPRYGFGLRGSFRYVPERDVSDFDELTGLRDVDSTVELGLGVQYTARSFEAFADVRQGIGGHESVVGEIGADVKVHPTDKLTLSLGPRVFMGTDDYADTYFGVSNSDSVSSGLDAYDPDGGVLSAGLELGASYALTDQWGVEGAVTWDRLTDDAADSPIVEQGDRDQYSVRIGVTRRVVLDF